MSYVGITLLLITTISLLMIFFLNRYIKLVLRSYWFYFVFSIAFLIYFIVIRYTDNVKTLIDSDMDFLRSNNPYTYSFVFSKVLLLDLCPVISILLPLSLIFDKTRNIAKVLSLFGIIGGIVTIYGSMIFIDEINVSLTEFIFVGEKPNLLMFSSHYLVIVLSTLVIFNSDCFTKWSFFGAIIFFISFIAYVLIIAHVLNINCNTTGLRMGDWYSPYPDKFWYSQYANLYNAMPLSFEFSVVFWYTIATIIIVLIMVCKNWLNRDPRNNSVPWYANVCLIAIHAYRIDKFINRRLSRIENICKKRIFRSVK